MTTQKKTPPQEDASSQDPTGSEDMKKIRRVDLDLHSDGIDHWQDEPQPPKDEKGGKDRPSDRRD